MRAFPAFAFFVLVLSGCAVSPDPRSQSHPGQRYWDAIDANEFTDRVPEPEARLVNLYTDELSVESCTQHRDALEHAIERVGIDLFDLAAAIECASLLDEPDWAAKRQQQFDDLVDYAWRDRRGRSVWQPVPVLHAGDIGILARERGLEVRWLRYRVPENAASLLVEAALADASGQVRMTYFDLLDGLVRIHADNPIVDYPIGRMTVARSYLESDALAGDALALTGYLNMNVETGETTPAAARRALERALDAGLLGAAVSLAELCLGFTDANCAPGTLGELAALLQEAELAEGWIVEAVARMIDSGAPSEDAGVRQAIDRAAEAVGPGRANYRVAELYELSARATTGNVTVQAVSDPSIPAPIRSLVERSASHDHPAALLRLWAALPDERRLGDDQEARDLIERASKQGHPNAMMIRAMQLGMDAPLSPMLLRTASERGFPAAQFIHGFARMRTATTGIGRAQAMEEIRQAAFGGNFPAARFLSQDALIEDADPEAARLWLASAWMMGDLEAAARLAALLTIHPELDPESDEIVMEIVTLLDRELGREGGLLAVDILSGLEPYNRDPEASIQLLKRMSDAGLGTASNELGRRSRFGVGVPQSTSAAASWFEKAIQQGDIEAWSGWAGMRVFDQGEIEDGMALFEQGAEAGDLDSSNDLAWLLCTGEAGVPRDPARGLRVIRELVERVEDPHPFNVGTLAACQAAQGDFEEAERNQRLAVKQARDVIPWQTDTIERMVERIDLYARGEPYIGTP